MVKQVWLKIGFIHQIEQLYYQLVMHFKLFQWLSVCYGQLIGCLNNINTHLKIKMKV